MITLWELNMELRNDDKLINVSNVLDALIEYIREGEADNPALEYLESAKVAYANDRPDATPKTRMVEYYRMWDGGQWDTDFIDVPYDTDEDGMGLAVQTAASAIDWKDEIPVFVGVYNVSEDEE